MDISATAAAVIAACIAAVANLATAANFFFARRQAENSDEMIKEMKRQAELSEKTIDQMKEQAELSEKTIDQMKEQAELSEKTVNADHKRSRLMLSIELFREWNRSASPEVAAAMRLIEAMGPKQCADIAASSSPPVEDMEVDGQVGYLVDTCLVRDPSKPPFYEKTNGEEKIVITAAGVKQLRHLGARYLNELEAVLSAWQKGVGDKAYLEGQFRFLDKEISKVMSTFREALKSQGATFEGIDAFLNRKGKADKPETEVRQQAARSERSGLP